MRHVVYRFYDANLRLLYVGRSANVGTRLATHSSTAPWFGEIDTITLEHHDDAAQCAAAEAHAIRTEQPAHNVVGSTLTPRPKRRYRLIPCDIPPPEGWVLSTVALTDVTRLRGTSVALPDANEHGKVMCDRDTAYAIAAAAGCHVSIVFPQAAGFGWDGSRFFVPEPEAA